MVSTEVVEPRSLLRASLRGSGGGRAGVARWQGEGACGAQKGLVCVHVKCGGDNGEGKKRERVWWWWWVEGGGVAAWEGGVHTRERDRRDEGGGAVRRRVGGGGRGGRTSHIS